MKGADYIILDCARPVLDALGLDENHDAGKFVTAFDALLNEAGIRDALVVQHMGHANERARGDSRFQDWPDATWTLVRESEDPASKRFIKAFGRSVEVAEVALSYNPQTHRLALGLGSRQDTKVAEVIPALVAFVQGEATPPTESKIRKAVKEAEGISDKAIRAALRLAVRRGLLDVAPGANNAKLYSVRTAPSPF